MKQSNFRNNDNPMVAMAFYYGEWGNVELAECGTSVRMMINYPGVFQTTRFFLCSLICNKFFVPRVLLSISTAL